MKQIQKNIGGLDCYLLHPDDDKAIHNIVLLAHGYGADGSDLISLARDWAYALPHTAFIAPNAPTQCEMSPFGYQWFSLKDFSQKYMEDGITIAGKTYHQFIDTIIEEYSVTEDKIILSGFSQGCMLSLYCGLTRNKPFAGILGYSGMLLHPETAQTCPHKSMLITLCHGVIDDVVPVDACYKAVDVLSNAGFEGITSHIYDHLPHGINPEGIKTGLEFIKTCFV